MRPIVLFLGILAVSGCGLKKDDPPPGDDFSALPNTWSAVMVASGGSASTGVGATGGATFTSSGGLSFTGSNGFTSHAQLHGRDGRYTATIDLGIVAGVFAKETVTLVLQGSIGIISFDDRYVTLPDPYLSTAWTLARMTSG